jgi:hypothetical protein
MVCIWLTPFASAKAGLGCGVIAIKQPHVLAQWRAGGAAMAADNTGGDHSIELIHSFARHKLGPITI